MDEIKPTTTLTFKSATPANYEQCMALDHSTSAEFVWQMVLDEGDGSTNLTFRPARLPRSMKVQYPRDEEALLQSWRLHAAFLVAQWEDQVVGYVNIRHEHAQETAWIADLIVDRPYRLRHVGTGLLNAAREWALNHNLRRLIVEVQTKNYPGITFLRKRGLRLCGYNDLYYPNQDIAVFFGETLR